jgi:polyisoprenyl-phosphate glycosyltransferase
MNPLQPHGNPATTRPTVTLVLPIHDEEEVIPELHRRLQDFVHQVGVSVEVIFVDDGSSDRSLQLLRELSSHEPRYRILSLSRNFGHQVAITAGLDHSTGDAVVVMDADLQDPPEVVKEMLEKWREGFDVVYAIRRKRQDETWFKLVTARVFYRLFAAMIPIDVPLDAGDFRLMSRRVVVALGALRETHRFVRGMVAWVGFRQAKVLYDRPGRFAGQTKYPLRKMARFAVDGITSFSILPLRFSTYLGIVMSLISLAVTAWALVSKYVFQRTVTGWTAIVVIIALFASVQFFMIGILGEYVGRIFEEIKGRPLYVVREAINMPSADGEVPASNQPPNGKSGRASLRK